MIVYLVTIWIGYCGMFMDTCSKSEIHSQYFNLEECREASYSARRMAKIADEKIYYICVQG